MGKNRSNIKVVYNIRSYKNIGEIKVEKVTRQNIGEIGPWLRMHPVNHCVETQVTSTILTFKHDHLINDVTWGYQLGHKIIVIKKETFSIQNLLYRAALHKIVMNNLAFLKLLAILHLLVRFSKGLPWLVGQPRDAHIRTNNIFHLCRDLSPLHFDN